jgi:hypothetical protein
MFIYNQKNSFFINISFFFFISYKKNPCLSYKINSNIDTYASYQMNNILKIDYLLWYVFFTYSILFQVLSNNDLLLFIHFNSSSYSSSFRMSNSRESIERVFLNSAIIILDTRNIFYEQLFHLHHHYLFIELNQISVDIKNIYFIKLIEWKCLDFSRDINEYLNQSNKPIFHSITWC